MSSSNNLSNMSNIGNTSPITADGKPRIPVGQVYVQNPGPWWVPPGLESTQGPGAKPIYYRNVFFGGDRDYVDDEDGWVTYRFGRRNRNRSRKPRRMMIVDDDASVIN